MFKIESEQDFIIARNTLTTRTKIQYTCDKCKKTFEKQLRACKSYPLICNACSRQTEIPLSDNPIIINTEAEFRNLKGKVHSFQKITYRCDVCNKEVTKPYYTINKLKCHQHSTKNTLLEKYGVESIFNRPDIRKNTISSVKNSEVTKKRQETCLQKYGVDNPHKVEKVKEKTKNTCLDKYGVPNPMQNKQVVLNMQNTCLEKYGVKSYSQTSDFITKLVKKYIYDNETFDSSWELYFWIYCKDNNISIERNTQGFNYTYNDEIHTYYPDFIVNGQLVEIKGDQFFKDDGTMQNPFDHTLDNLYEAKHQCGIQNNVHFIKEADIKPYIDWVNNKYTEWYVPLFNIDLPFPYLNEDLSDKSDMGLIRHFHKSIYDANRQGKPAPTEAWKNKNLIKKTALNRLKYKNKCTPADILQGFNVTKIANKVSVFKPNLATDLIKKYLSDTDIIYDPFSGFSGRMLGAVNCNIMYFGYDINEVHVHESNEIINYKHIEDMCHVEVRDILATTPKDYRYLRGTALFTCPPYGGKEHWDKNKNEIEKSCDEWIDICIEKYKVDKYLFVVDNTKKYKDYIVESFSNNSIFNKSKEYIVLIQK